MKKVIAYGAGNIGRGFVGQLFHESGYEVVFIDVNKTVVGKLNEDRRYPIKIVSPKGIREIIISNVRAVDAADTGAVAAEIASADIMATAVGVNILPRIIGNLTAGLRKRWEAGNFTPFNIILCENLIDSSKYMKKLLSEALTETEQKMLDGSVGLVEASIGRMVPVMTEEMQEGNPLRVWVEEYCMFPVDRDGFVGEIPEIKNLIPYSPFSYYLQRKLFVHNLGHAMVSYLGYLLKYEYVWQGAENPVIHRLTELAMKEAAAALALEHGADPKELDTHVQDLIYRFGNRHLGDTVKRVGGDPMRKLSPNDRLAGAARLCLKHGIIPSYICLGIWAALRFDPEGDASAAKLKALIAESGEAGALESVCGFEPGSPLIKLVLEGNTAGPGASDE